MYELNQDAICGLSQSSEYKEAHIRRGGDVQILHGNRLPYRVTRWQCGILPIYYGHLLPVYICTSRISGTEWPVMSDMPL